VRALKHIFWLLVLSAAIVGTFTIVLYWPFILNFLDKAGDERYGWYVLGIVIGAWSHVFLRDVLKKLDEWGREVDEQ